MCDAAHHRPAFRAEFAFVRTAVSEPASFVAISLSLTVPSKARRAGVQCVLRHIQTSVFKAQSKKKPAANPLKAATVRQHTAIPFTNRQARIRVSGNAM